jgi:alkaline phosphatase
VGTPDIQKHVLHVTFRPHVVCALSDVLLAGGHPAFSPRSQRALWREKLYAANAAKYLEPPEQAALPEE